MTISVSCDDCFQEYRLNDSLAGRKVKCKECGGIIQVPSGESNVDEVEFLEDSHQFDEDEEVDDVPRQRKRLKEPPPVPKGTSRRTVTPSVPTDRQGAKSKKRSGCYHSALDDVPNWVILSVMWSAIGVLCVMFWLWGSGNGRLQIADAGDQSASEIDFGPPPATVELLPVVSVPVPALPDLPALNPIQTPASLYSMVALPTDTVAHRSSEIRIWLPAGEHAPHSLGCVFMAPESMTFLSGSRLDPGLSPDQQLAALPLLQPLVSAGYAVVCFSVDGDVAGISENASEQAMDQAFKDAYRRFRASQAGLVNLRNAVEWVTTKVHQIDPQRLFISGRHEAATFALLAAAHEPRLKGCMAIDPICDLVAYYETEVDAEELPVPEAATDVGFLKQCSPIGHAEHIRCPVFLCRVSFEDNDSSFPTLAEQTVFSQQLSSIGKIIEFTKVGPRGDYDTNQDKAVQYAVIWLKRQPTESLKTQ